MIPTSTVSQPVEIGLRIIGIWPNSSILFRLLWTLGIGTSLTFQYYYFLTHFSTEELPNLIDSLSTILPHSLLFFKLFVLWINNRIFNDILMAMSNDWREYSSMCVMIDKAVLAHRCSKLTISIYSIAVLLYSIASVNFRKQADDVCRELLIKMKFPFEFCKSPIYEIVVCMQFVDLMAISSAIGVLDALMVTLCMGIVINIYVHSRVFLLFTIIFFSTIHIAEVSKKLYVTLKINFVGPSKQLCRTLKLIARMMLHIGGQIDLIRQEVEGISFQNNKYDLPTAIVRSLITRHHKIITFSENIESLFSYIALMQFISNTMIICCIGFLIVTSLGTDEGIRMLVKTVFFYIAITMEAFIFCFAGEYLSNKSKTIGDAAYESIWYNLKPQHCRVLLFMIMRSQKRLTITAGKFMDLSLEGFTNSLKASASYISVLYAMY